jgi:hypothetical protein
MQTYSLPQNAEGLYKKAKRTRDCSVGVYTKNKDHDVFLSCFASMLTYMAHVMDNDTDYIQLAEFAYRQAKAEGIIKE